MSAKEIKEILYYRVEEIDSDSTNDSEKEDNLEYKRTMYDDIIYRRIVAYIDFLREFTHHNYYDIAERVNFTNLYDFLHKL